MKSYIALVFLFVSSYSFAADLNGTISAEVVCEDTNNGAITLIDLTVDGGFAPYDFQWSDGSTTEDIEVTLEGDYWVTVTDALCGEASLEISVTAICCQDCYPIDANIGPGSIHVLIECQESGGFNYQWSDGMLGNPRTDLAIGTYCVTATSNSGCVQIGCWDVDTECDSDPVTDSNVEVTHSCTAAPMSGALEVLNPQQNLYYFWEGPNNYNAEGATISNLFPGDYCLSITGNIFGSPCPMAAGCFTIEPDGDQCCDDCYPIDANINQGYIFVDVECLNGGGFTFEWSDGGTGNPRNNLEPGNYCVTVTRMLDNCTMSGCWDIMQGCLPIQQLIDLNAEISCSSGDNGSIELISLQFNSEATPIWTDSDGYFVGSGYELTNMPPGEYCVEIMESVFGGCVLAEGCFTIDETDLRVGIDYIQRPTECDGFCSSSIALSVSSSSSNITYEWTGPDGFTASWQPISNVCVGDYFVTVTDEDTGCSVILEADVCCCNWDQNSQGSAPDDYCFFPNWNLPPLVITAVITPIDSDNGVTTGSIDINTTIPNNPDNNSPNNYVWTGPDGFVSFDQDISGLSEGEYCVSVDNGCESGNQCFCITDCSTTEWDISEVVTPSCPGADAGIIELSNVSISDPSGLCEAGSYIFMMEGQDDIEGDMATFEGLRGENTYVVTIFDEKTGCSEDFSFYIGEAPPNINIDEDFEDTCPGYEYGTITLNAFGDFEPYTYNWSQGGNGSAAYDLGIDDYFVTITDSRGCSEEFGPFSIGDANQVYTDEGEFREDCIVEYYCNGNDIGENDNLIATFDYWDQDCGYRELYCESDGEPYYPDGTEGSSLEFIGYNPGPINTDVCTMILLCKEDDSDSGEVLDGIEGEEIHFSGADGPEGCYYCFTATFCEFIMDDGSIIEELKSVVSHITMSDVPNGAGCSSEVNSCLVNIYCSSDPAVPIDLGLDICDPDCTNNTDINGGNLPVDPDLLCSQEEMENIASSFIGSGDDRSVEMRPSDRDGLSVGMYPNPFASDFRLKIESDKNRSLTFNITNITGSVVQKLFFPIHIGDNLIYFGNLRVENSGVYFLTISDNENNILITLPIVKQ